MAADCHVWSLWPRIKIPTVSLISSCCDELRLLIVIAWFIGDAQTVVSGSSYLVANRFMPWLVEHMGSGT